MNGKLLDGWPEGLVVRGSKSNWHLGTSSTTWWLILFKFFLNYQQNQIRIQQAVKQEQIGGVAHMPEYKAVILRGLHRLETWIDRNLINFNKDKPKSCTRIVVTPYNKTDRGLAR